MIDQTGSVKILDFGLARLQAEANASRLTKRGSVMGTIDFMAPEQWEDPMGATIQSDIYSLGCTLYYLVTGTPPYGGESYTHWLKKQEAHRLGPVPRVEHEHGEKLQPIIDRMMAKALKERFASPHEVVDALGPLSDHTDVPRYADTPAPKVTVTSTAFSHAPVPTVNVSSNDLLGSGHADPLREEFAPAENGSGEKTRRPHESSTDIDSDSQIQPPRPAWFKSRKWQASLGVLAVVFLSAMWLMFRPAQDPVFAAQVGALPGLNGDWWFEETPWFGPGFRKALMQAIRSGETEIGGISLEDFKSRLNSADTQSVQNDLETVAQELESRLPERERSYAGLVLIVDRTHSSYDEDLLKILPPFGGDSSQADDEALKADWSPTELHLFAGILHHLCANNSEHAVRTEQLYEAAIDSYDESDPVEKVLGALARSDFSRFLGDRREYSKSILRAQEAATAVPEAGLFQISLHCQMADQYRKLENLDRAFEQLHVGDDAAEAWAKRMNLATGHPLQAEMLERQAWLRVDGWQMQEAIDSFEKATKIRAANRKQGNDFAWRPILFNKQGTAMALHFQGRGGTDPADKPPVALAIYKDLIQSIEHDNDGERFSGREAEARSRLPNIYERQADVYLFGDPPNYERAQRRWEKPPPKPSFKALKTAQPCGSTWPGCITRKAWRSRSPAPKTMRSPKKTPTRPNTGSRRRTRWKPTSRKKWRAPGKPSRSSKRCSRSRRKPSRPSYPEKPTTPTMPRLGRNSIASSPKSSPSRSTARTLKSCSWSSNRSSIPGRSRMRRNWISSRSGCCCLRKPPGVGIRKSASTTSTRCSNPPSGPSNWRVIPSQAICRTRGKTSKRRWLPSRLFRRLVEGFAEMFHAVAVGAHVGMADPRRGADVDPLLFRFQKKLHIVHKPEHARRDFHAEIRVGLFDDLRARLGFYDSSQPRKRRLRSAFERERFHVMGFTLVLGANAIRRIGAIRQAAVLHAQTFGFSREPIPHDHHSQENSQSPGQK